MKTARHEMILALIEKYDIETQDDLAKKLRENGVNVTQATVSRDIKELRLIKVLLDDGVYKYATVDKAETGLKDRFYRIFTNSVISLVSCGNLIIIKTVSGTANAAAEAVDSMKWPEILGTIAGDNTIFVALKNGTDTQELEARFKDLLI